MLQFLVLAAAATAVPAPGASAPPPDCSYDEAALVAMPYDSFDQDIDGGWRTLGDKGWDTQGADTLRAHQPLTEAQRALLNWHEGQERASAGDYTRAIPLLMRGVREDAADQSFVEYAQGTVAFLKHDKPALLAARARLAAIPKPVDWGDGTQTAVFKGKTVTFKFSWPANLDVLDRLIQCFDQPYAQAYGCRPAPSGAPAK